METSHILFVKMELDKLSSHTSHVLFVGNQMEDSDDVFLKLWSIFCKNK